MNGHLGRLSLFSLLFFAQVGSAGEIAPSNPVPDKSGYTFLHPTPLALRRAYNTDRPSKTDSPYTIDAGVFQIETDVASWTLDERNPADPGVRVRTWLIAQTNFKLGLTNWMDLQVIPQGYVNRRTSGSEIEHATRQHGFGDTTVRLKINFIGNEGGPFALALVSSLKIPTNTNHLGNGVFEPGFGLPINCALPGGFTLFGQTRVDILDEPHSAKPRVQWSNPVGLSRQIVGKLSGYAEFYSAMSGGRNHPWIGTVGLGVIYQVSPDFSVDLNGFKSITESADDCNVFVGFARRL